MIDLYTKKFTVYNIVPSVQGVSNIKYGNKRIVENCYQEGEISDKLRDSSMQLTTGKFFYTKDIKHYRPATWQSNGYYSLKDEEKLKFYTLAPGDIIIFDEVNDSVTNSSEFNSLKTKYSNIYMTVNKTDSFVLGLETDHIYAVSI